MRDGSQSKKVLSTYVEVNHERLTTHGLIVMEYTPCFALGFLVLGLGFYVGWKVFIAPRKRYPIIPTTPVSGDVINDTTCILLSDGAGLFTDGSTVIKTERNKRPPRSL